MPGKYKLGFDIWGLLLFLGIMDYRGMANSVVLLGLTVPPCLAFMCFSLDRKNMLALLSATVFFICHLAHAIINFIA